MADNIITISMPPALADQVSRLIGGLTSPAPKAVYHPDAQDWLRRKSLMLKPATFAECVEWFASLCHGVNGVTEPLFERRAKAIWSISGGLPAFVWCDATMHACWRRTSFLPTPGECHEVLSSYAAPLLAEIAALESIVTADLPLLVREAQPYQLPPPPDWALNGTRSTPEEAAERRLALARAHADLEARAAAKSSEAS